MFLIRRWINSQDSEQEEVTVSTVAWVIAQAIENGENEQEARLRILSNISANVVLPASASVATGGVIATATGLGGVGLAFGGGAVGIGAATAIAAPAVAAGVVGYGVYRVAQDFRSRSRVSQLRHLVDYFRGAGQPEKADKVLYLEGKGQLDRKQEKMRGQSAEASLRLLSGTTSEALVGLFGSPRGEFILTFDLSPQHWCYIRLISTDSFDGQGMNSRGQEFDVAGWSSVDSLRQQLDREGYLEIVPSSESENNC